MIPIAAVLLVVGWAVSLFVIGLVLRFGSGAEALAWGVMFILLPLSGVFYPIESLPAFLQPIARLLPTTHAFAALRGLVDGEPLNWAQVGIAAVGCVRDARARALVPRAHAEAVPPARLHHALHVTREHAPPARRCRGSGPGSHAGHRTTRWLHCRSGLYW